MVNIAFLNVCPNIFNLLQLEFWICYKGMDQILPEVQLVLWSILPRNVLQYDTDRQSTYKRKLLVNDFYQKISIFVIDHIKIKLW